MIVKKRDGVALYSASRIERQFKIMLILNCFVVLDFLLLNVPVVANYPFDF